MTVGGSRDKRKADARELRGDGKHSSVTLPVASAPGQAGPPGPKLVKPKLDVDCMHPAHSKHALSLPPLTSHHPIIAHLRSSAFQLRHTAVVDR